MVAALLLLTTPWAHAADLVQIYSQALQSDPQLREAEANRLAAREAKPIALANLLPQLNGTGSVGHDDISGRQSVIVTQSTSVSYKTKSDTTQYQLELRQSVFHWDQWVALHRADASVAQAEADYQAARQSLVVRLAQRYFDVLGARDTVDASQASLESVSRQLEQAEKRFEVGLIAITDVQEAKAARDQAAADLIAAKRTLATNQELLREYTGAPFDALAAPGDDMPLKTPTPASEDQWVNAALQQNLTVVSSRLAAQIAGEDVRAASAQHYPSLDLVLGRGYFDTPADRTVLGQKLPADANQTDDSVSLQLRFPIYSGGGTSARVRQQVYLQRAARERLERAARETERQARDSYLGVLSEISRVQALKQSLESSRTAMEATAAGFEVGTRTTVDVLDARRQLFTAQTNYSRSRYAYIMNIIQLKQAAGILSEQDLAEINGWMK
jgi:outer membrane protein